MKKIFKKLKKGGRQVAQCLLLAVLTLLAIPAAQAQTQVPLKCYWLTNSTPTNGFNLTTGAAAVAANGTTNIYSQPFPIWRGRGFMFNAGFWTTNASGSNVNFSLRFASVHGTNGLPGGPQVTNWSALYPLVLNFANNGTNEQFAWTNIQPSVADNVSLGQLVSANNAATGTLWLDPTNTFIGVYP